MMKCFRQNGVRIKSYRFKKLRMFAVGCKWTEQVLYVNATENNILNNVSCNIAAVKKTVATSHDRRYHAI